MQKKVEEIKDTQVHKGGAIIFTLNTPTKTGEKVKINEKYFHMQVDTGSGIALIPVNFWLDIGTLRLKKSFLQLKRFDGTIIKTWGTFEGTFETKNHFEIIPITVVACTKDHGLSGKYLLKFDSSKLVNSMVSEEQEIGLLKGYKASIILKENYHPKYIQARRLPIQNFTYCSLKTKKKMIQQSILEKITHGGSDWTSPIVK